MDISKQIYQYYSDNDSVRDSNTLGASMIDGECERRSYYNYYNRLTVTDGRILRLFETGNLQEERLINDLKNIGITSISSQEKLIDKDMPFFGGRPDLICEEYGIVEIKTHNDKSYKALLKKGLKQSKPSHYNQIMLYMGWSDLDKGLYVALNKNDENIYTEIVEFDDIRFSYLRDLADRILSKKHTDKVSEKKDFFTCKMCPYRDLCHGA